jgi:succinate dehydrogenase/fumarate reductase flavoprotein subunit
MRASTPSEQALSFFVAASATRAEATAGFEDRLAGGNSTMALDLITESAPSPGEPDPAGLYAARKIIGTHCHTREGATSALKDLRFGWSAGQHAARRPNT